MEAKAPLSPLDQLRETLRGRVVLPTDQDYDDIRKAWNFNVTLSKPSLVIHCLGTWDVVAAVKYCRAQNLEATVACGRHSRFSAKDGVVMIDLSGMRGVIVDPKAKTATAQGGCRNSDFDRECALYGLHSPAGTNGDTGLGGLTVGGGFGYLTRRYGFTCENVLSAEIVLADGTVVTASEEENTDLFFAVRGAGANFGIVTKFVIRLHEIGHLPKSAPTSSEAKQDSASTATPTTTAPPSEADLRHKVLGGLQVYPFPAAAKVLAHFDAIGTDQLDSDAHVLVALAHGPDHRPCVMWAPSYTGHDIHEGQKLLASLTLKDPAPVVDAVRPMTYLELQDQLKPATPPGFWYERAVFLDKLPSELIDQLLHLYSEVPNGAQHSAILFHMFKSQAKPPRSPSAFAHRDARIWLALVCNYSPDVKDTAIAWANKLLEVTKQFRVGVYTNIINAQEPGLSLFGANTQRLRELKHKFDPTNFFRNTHAI